MSGIGSDVSRPQTDRFETGVDAAIGISWRPSRRILEKPNGADLSIGAKVEPMQRAPRDANQVAGFHFYRDNGTSFWMNMKYAAAVNDETNFVFIVPML